MKVHCSYNVLHVMYLWYTSLTWKGESLLLLSIFGHFYQFITYVLTAVFWQPLKKDMKWWDLVFLFRETLIFVFVFTENMWEQSGSFCAPSAFLKFENNAIEIQTFPVFWFTVFWSKTSEPLLGKLRVYSHFIHLSSAYGKQFNR